MLELQRIFCNTVRPKARRVAKAWPPSKIGPAAFTPDRRCPRCPLWHSRQTLRHGKVVPCGFLSSSSAFGSLVLQLDMQALRCSALIDARIFTVRRSVVCARMALAAAFDELGGGCGRNGFQYLADCEALNFDKHQFVRNMLQQSMDVIVTPALCAPPCSVSLPSPGLVEQVTQCECLCSLAALALPPHPCTLRHREGWPALPPPPPPPPRRFAM